MKTLLLQKNIVVNGQFNLALLDKYFFIKNDIISEEEFSKMQHPALFNGFNSHLVTDKFEITINPIQLVVYSVKSGDDDKINEFIIKIIKASGIGNFPSFGMNFEWALQFENKEQVQEKSKEYFYNENTKLMPSFFNSEDANYGFYASKDIMGARLKLDIKPINNLNYPVKGVVPMDALFHQFNFHFALEGTDIIPFLEKYEEYKKETDKIISFYK